LLLDQNDGGTIATTETEGSISSSLTGASAAGYAVKWQVVGSADAISTQVGYEDPSGIATGYTDDQGLLASVRGGALNSASNFTFEVFVGTGVTTPVAKKSVPVSVVVSNGTGLSLADGVTVDGLSVYSGKSRTITKNSDSSGKVTFDIVGAKAEATDEIDFVVSVNGVAPGANLTGSVDATVTWAAANLEIYAVKDLAANPGVSIKSGATYSMDYVVIDQWGTAAANGEYRVVGYDKASSNSERTTAADFAVATPVVDGKATLTITDNGVGTGSYGLVAGFATVEGTITDSGDNSVNTTVLVVADSAPSTITLEDLVYGSAQLTDANSDGDYSDTGDTDNRTKLILETETLSSYTVNTATATATAPDVTSNIEVTLAGTVTNAAGVAVAYAPVTMTAANLMFVVNGNYAVDTITFHADSSGEFSVNVYSASGGINNIAITSGSASASESLTYAGAVAGNAADFTVTTPGASEPGRTVDVSVKVVDKFGNGVQGATVVLSSTGPGYLINTSGTTLKDGTFNTKLLLGANDSGTAVVTATTTLVKVETSKTSTVIVGVGAVASSEQKVNAGSFKGFVALYAKGFVGQKMTAIVAGKWEKVDALASNFERVVRYTGAGYDIIATIYIDGVEKGTFSLTTK
jgi:hypothetical protein